MKDSKPKKKSGYAKSIVISVLLHALLVVALVWGTDFTMSKPEPSGKMVEAVVIDPSLVRQQAQQIRSQREAAAKKEQQRLDKLRRESEQLEKSRKAEEERIRKLKEQQAREAKAAREAEKVRQQKEKERKAEELRVRQEKERAAKLEAERKAKEAAVAKAEKERIAREKAAQKAEKERVAKEAAEKARKEKQRLERIEKERKEQEAALDNIFSGLETEAEHNSAARQQHAQSEAQKYGAIFKGLIEQNLLLEDSYRGKSCKVNLRLIPTGNGAIVGNLNILDGDSRLCSATKRAIAQVGTFPLPKEQDVINALKNINLTVEPEL